MYTGKTLFTQVMDFLPWKTFHRLVSRYDGDYRSPVMVALIDVLDTPALARCS